LGNAIISKMTTPAEQTEQMFFYGEAIDQEPVSALALLGYADLTAGSAVIFEVVTIAVFVFTYWKDLCPWSSAMLKALIKAIYAVVTSVIQARLTACSRSFCHRPFDYSTYYQGWRWKANCQQMHRPTHLSHHRLAYPAHLPA
jgi:hypothetical protein